MKRHAGIVAAILLLGGAALAHDFWVEPSTFRPARGASVAVRLFVGERFEGEAFPRSPEHLERFVAAGPSGAKDVPGLEDDEPAGRVVLDEEGVWVLGYRSRRSKVELEAEEFEAYLEEEGLEHVVAARAKSGATGTAGREAFSRCAKSVLWVGEGAETGFDRRLDFTLELVPEKNPYRLGESLELPVLLLHEKKPREGALVKAFPKEKPDEVVKGRTDKEGRVRLALTRRGTWLVKAVHMVPAPEGIGADWESLWASLTFEVPPASSPSGGASSPSSPSR